LAQSYSNLEVILVDDGSTDSSAAILDEWATQDERIKVFHKENGGLSDARNYGLDRATGRYIAFVDSDDYIDSEMYSEMIKAMQSTDSDMACCGRFYWSDTYSRPSKCIEKAKLMTSQEAIHEMLDNGCVEEAAWDKLYRAELWDNLRFPLGEINEDIVVMPEIIRRSKRIIHVGKPFYYYCYNENSITKSGYNLKKDIMFKHLEDLTAFVMKYYPEESRYVDVIKAKYALNTLFSIVLHDETETFRNSYRGYKKMLRSAYPQMLKCKNITEKQKVEAALLIIGIYKQVWSFKKKLRRR
jgi:glycosyltransferase involved in cell wall biosynthesis